MKDTIYSRWLNNELTEEEKLQLKASGDLEILEKIIAETDTWWLPPLNQDAYSRVKEKIEARKKSTEGEANVISLKSKNTFWMYAAAASVVMVLIAAYFIYFVNTTTTYQSLAGQQLKVTLPDQSVLILNGQSKVSFNESSFIEKRELQLEGDAYLEVVKKGDFKVAFSHGEVRVLGTKFNVLAGRNMSMVKCYEGKVMVLGKNKTQQILVAGKGVRLMDGTQQAFDFTSSNPEWINGESVFKAAPLLEVMNALTIQYNVEFEISDIDTRRNYSGKFVHKDLKTALDMVFVPMGITYSIDSSGTIKKVILK